MKTSFIQDDSLEENEIKISFKEHSKLLDVISNVVTEYHKSESTLMLSRHDVDYFIPVNDIMFFETNDNKVIAHQSDNAYETKYKLYELEELLPSNFIRISKSTICNINYVLSIEKNIASASKISFRGSQKNVYVSRMYYQDLKQLIESRYKL